MRIRTHRAVCTASLLPWFVAAVALTAAAAQNSGQQQELPDSPSAVTMQRTGAVDQFQEQTASPSQPTESQPQSNPAQKPVGTAAAERPVTTGVAASSAAGAAVAPAKQRRARMLLIKVGAIVGAGVAVGTVAALSSASPSRPPGSH